MLRNRYMTHLLTNALFCDAAILESTVMLTARFHIICSVSAVREALPAPPGGRLPGTGQLCAGQVQRRSHGLQRLQPVLLLGELPEGDEPAGQAGQHLLRHHGDPPVLPHILHLQCALQVGELILYFFMIVLR
jgi:hypothetical protein